MVFYYAEYDRYRLIELVFDMERRQARLTHEEIARRASFLTPAQSATIGHMTRTLGDKKHRIHRRTLIVALAWGLRLPQWKIDALLDLFDGQPLSDSEALHFLSSYHAGLYGEEPRHVDYRPEALHENALQLMNDVLTWSWPAEGPKQASVRFYSSLPGSEIESTRQLVEMESRRGMRLVVTSLPTHVTEPDPVDYETWFREEQELWRTEAGNLPSDTYLREYFELTIKRSERFRSNLDEFGEVVVHSLPQLRDALASASPLVRSRRRNQVMRLIELLEGHDRFHVGLTNDTPTLDSEIKSFDWAMTRGGGSPFRKPVTWGLRYVEWTDPSTVLFFVHNFWSNFYRLPPAQREKSSVIELLRGCLNQG